MTTTCWFVSNDGCGMVCVAVTWVLVIFADHVVINIVLLPWFGPTAHFYAIALSFLAGSVLALISHLRAMTTNPGAVPLTYQPDGALVRASLHLLTA